jgi:hypothetical protein
MMIAAGCRRLLELKLTVAEVDVACALSRPWLPHLRHTHKKNKDKKSMKQGAG